MIAGKGVLHSEMFVTSRAKRTTFECFQLWLNLPKARKMEDPSYQMVWDKEAPLIRIAASNQQHSDNSTSTTNAEVVGEGAAEIKVISGAVNGNASPAVPAVPMTFLHCKLDPRSRLRLSVPQSHHTMLYVMDGEAVCEGSQRSEKLPAEHFALFNVDGDHLSISNQNDAKVLDFVVLHGEPLREPVVARGPFVMNTQQEIVQANLDYQRGYFGSMEEAYVGELLE
jgi:redox-sensitive bicupin YhaK (pirin superfamily)